MMTKSKHILVHLHLYYINQLDEILARLQNLQELKFDLYVTMIEKSPAAEQKIKQFKPDAHILQLENKGYDIGPFMEVLHSLDLDKYNYLLKIHTKGTTAQNYTRINGKRFSNKLWSRLLYEALLADRQRVFSNLQLLETDNIGMLSSTYLITDDKKLYRQFLPQINEILQAESLPKVDTFSFVAGTMFWAKVSLFKPLQKYRLADFPVTDGKIKEGTPAHCFERLFGAVVQAQGYKLHGVKSFDEIWHFTLNEFKRFVFYKKHTKSGNLLIKICKIPIWTQKINKD